MSELERRRDYAGPAILSYGFRPFFLLGALYAAGTVLAWVPVLHGRLALATTFSPRDWHVHEMLFGFLPAVIAGFLLTAIPNWTGRLPLRGGPLMVLLATWASGRVAVTCSTLIGPLPAAAVDLAFLILLAAAAAREILAGRNWNNLKVLAVLTGLIVANAIFHTEAYLTGFADLAVRLGVAAVLVLVTRAIGSPKNVPAAFRRPSASSTVSRPA